MSKNDYHEFCMEMFDTKILKSIRTDAFLSKLYESYSDCKIRNIFEFKIIISIAASLKQIDTIAFCLSSIHGTNENEMISYLTHVIAHEHLHIVIYNAFKESTNHYEDYVIEDMLEHIYGWRVL